jgi:hypothetical protein
MPNADYGSPQAPAAGEALKMLHTEREALRWTEAHARSWAQLVPEGFARGYLTETADRIGEALAELDQLVDWRDDAGRRVDAPTA